MTTLSPQQLGERVNRVMFHDETTDAEWPDAIAALSELVRLANQAETLRGIATAATAIEATHQSGGQEWWDAHDALYDALLAAGYFVIHGPAATSLELTTGDCTQSPPASDPSGAAGGEGHA